MSKCFQPQGITGFKSVVNSTLLGKRVAERLRILAALIEDPSLEWVTVGMLVRFRCPGCGASLQPCPSFPCSL